MIQAYKKFWKGYLDFYGSTSRSDFWLAALANWIVLLILALIAAVIASGNTASEGSLSVMGVFMMVYTFATLFPSIAIMIRRLQDAGFPRKQLLWILLPYAGAIILIVKLCRPSAEADETKTAPTRPASTAAAIRTDPKPVSSVPAQNAQQNEVDDVSRYMKLADKYAHIESLFAENAEKAEIEAQLLAGGRNAQTAISLYLQYCALGQAAYGWWNGAAALTCMLRKIDRDNAKDILLTLKNKKTNIWEYHTQVIDTAEKELLALAKESGGYAADGHIPAEYAHAELLRLQNVYPPEKRLEECFAMQPSVEAWSNADKAFYYFIAGGAARVLYPTNKSNLAFYAAQVVSDPNPNSLGWQHLRQTEGASLPATMESASRMQEKYPLPKTIEEAKSYVFGWETDASKEKAYTLEAGLNELVALFRSYPQLDQKKIQTVGQKIYDADIPLVSGVGGMHQLYARFKERMPMYGAELSRIWDGIGDWAD